MPAATDRFAPVTVINGLTAELSMRDLAVEQGEVFRQPPKLADVPIDRRALIVWKLLSGHPHPPRASNRSACGHFGSSCACRIEYTSFLSRARCRTTW
ncbi:hypothetical protein ACFKHW_28870 [Bradyrhizobium lupini]|uniref:hypothetical protein n=1 Tax=Rhizobium lupini TaxID=136996 RepID=UPI00366DE202